MAKRAVHGFTTRVDGRKRFVSRGDVVADKDPIMKGRERNFEDVEEATAVPGTKQRRRRETKQPESEDEG